MENKKYRMGLRTIKSSIAVAICVALAYIFNNRNVIFFGGVACVICMQQTSKDTVIMGVNRFAGTILGGILGFIVIMIGTLIEEFHHGFEIPIIAAASLIAIYLCNLLNLNEATSISCIVLLNVSTNYDGITDAAGAFSYVSQRVIFTFIGIIIALLVNRFIFPYKCQPNSENIDNSLPKVDEKK